MTTARDICTMALFDCGIVGVGQTPSAEDINGAFTRMNMMISQWQRKRWMVYRLETLGFTSTGAVSYTVGPAGNFNITKRPDRIELAFARQLTSATPNQIDFPLEVIEARETYNLISLKQLGSLPMAVWYDPDYPLGKLYPWPVPQSGIYAIHITYKTVLSQFANLSDAVTFPPEYEAALLYNLAERLLLTYQLPPNPNLEKLARDSREVLRDANNAMPRLQMPPDLVRGSLYNIYSDSTY